MRLSCGGGGGGGGWLCVCVYGCVYSAMNLGLLSNDVAIVYTISRAPAVGPVSADQLPVTSKWM
jgi:hypothetical protein